MTELPDWPAMMDEGKASAYLDLSPATFRAVVARAKLAPVELGARVTRWRRRDLDALIDKLPARQKAQGDSPLAAELEIDPAEAALQKAERRARGGKRTREVRQPGRR